MRTVKVGLQGETSTSEQGGKLVEFALVMAAFCAILLAIVAFAQALQAYHFVDNAAREATRYAIVHGQDCNDFQAACPATGSDVQRYVDQIGFGIGLDANQLRVNTTWSPGEKQGSTAQMQVSYPVNLLFGFLPKATVNLSSTSQMVISQ